MVRISRCIRGNLVLLEVLLLFFCASTLTKEVDLFLERGDESSLFAFPVLTFLDVGTASMDGGG